MAEIITTCPICKRTWSCEPDKPMIIPVGTSSVLYTPKVTRRFRSTCPDCFLKASESHGAKDYLCARQKFKKGMTDS